MTTNASSSDEPQHKKSHPLVPLESHTNDLPTGSSDSSIVPAIHLPLPMSIDTNANTANERTSSNTTTNTTSRYNIKWWKRIPFMRLKRRRTESQVDGRNNDEELYGRSLLESFLSSLSSKDRSLPHCCSHSDSKSKDQVAKSERDAFSTTRDRGTTPPLATLKPRANGEARDGRNLTSPAYRAHFTPNEDALQDERCLNMDDHTERNETVGVNSESRIGNDGDGLDVGSLIPTLTQDEDERRRLQRRVKMKAVRARLLEKHHQRSRARKKRGSYVVCLGVTLAAFVVASVWIAKSSVKIQTNFIEKSNRTRRSSSSSSSGSTVEGRSDADSSTTATSHDGLAWSFFDLSVGTSMYTDVHTYVHCILMAFSLWMLLVVVTMHVVFPSFRTYSLPFVLELSWVQCGYWITSLLRVLLETSRLSDMTYLLFCVLECFFSCAQISFSCAIAFNMYRSVVSYVDVLMDSQSAKRRYTRCTLHVLLLSLVAAVTLALAGLRSRPSSASSLAQEETIVDEKTFAPCLNGACRPILYVYYPLLAFALNFVFYVRFKRTIGQSYPTSAIGRLNKVARSYLVVFLVCWGSLMLLTALQVSTPFTVPLVASFALQSIFDVLGVCTAAITLTNYHRCRKAFDFGLSLKAIDPSSLEFDDPLTIVGEGTFAIVVKARWRQGKQGHDTSASSIDVAVKTYKHAQIEYLEHVKEEAYLSSKLVHPCIMRTYGCYTSGRHLYIVYEYLGGGTLQQLIDLHRTTPFSYERGLRYAHMIAVGMRFLHGLAVPIVHRDLKPLNCIFDSEHEMLKIADFGASRLLCTRDVMAPQPPVSPSADVTVQMTTNIGSACWAAPEVLKDEATAAYSIKIDVYSFGIICWQLYTCSVPYADIPGSVLAVAEAVLSGVRPRIPPACPRLFAKIMERCWHDTPSRRPSFEYIVQLLEGELCEERRRQMMEKHGRDDDAVVSRVNSSCNSCDDSTICPKDCESLEDQSVDYETHPGL